MSSMHSWMSVQVLPIPVGYPLAPLPLSLQSLYIQVIKCTHFYFCCAYRVSNAHTHTFPKFHIFAQELCGADHFVTLQMLVAFGKCEWKVNVVSYGMRELLEQAVLGLISYAPAVHQWTVPNFQKGYAVAHKM